MVSLCNVERELEDLLVDEEKHWKARLREDSLNWEDKTLNGFTLKYPRGGVRIELKEFLTIQGGRSSFFGY